MAKQKRAVGRPAEPQNDIVPGIPDTPENIARAMWDKMPKKDGEWRYQKKYGKTRN